MTSETPARGGARAGAQPIRVSLRHYFSTRLLWNAFHASSQAQAIEQAHTGHPTFDIQHNSAVLSSVVSAAAFIEACINEFFQDAQDRHGLTGDGYLASFPSGVIEAMSATWVGTNDGSQLRALEKWQLVLIFNGRQPLDRGANPYQDAQLVMQLRNTILHFRPENVVVDDAHRLERLKGKFSDNGLMRGSGNPWWPDHCLGHGCAQWAARSALALTDHVCQELGISPNYKLIANAGWLGAPPAGWK
jgi:hypothetical protein